MGNKVLAPRSMKYLQKGGRSRREKSPVSRNELKWIPGENGQKNIFIARTNEINCSAWTSRGESIRETRERSDTTPVDASANTNVRRIRMPRIKIGFKIASRREDAIFISFLSFLLPIKRPCRMRHICSTQEISSGVRCTFVLILIYDSIKRKVKKIE